MNALFVPAMSPRMVAARNRLYRGSARFACAFGGRRWELTLPESVPAPVWRVRLTLAMGDWPLTVLLDGLLPADWPESGLDAAALARLPPSLAGALLEVCLEEVVEALEPKLGKPLLCDSLDLIHESAVPRPEGVPFRLARDDGHILYGLLAAPPPVLEGLAGAGEMSAADRKPLATVLHDLPIDLPLEVGVARLRTGALRDLEMGDVILVRAPGEDRRAGRTEKDEAQGTRVRLPLSARRGLNAKLHGGTVRVEGWSMTEAEWMDETGVSPGPGGVDDVPVLLRFSLGTLACTVGELAALKPGHVFVTTARTDAPVSIAANGKTLGQGSLVDVNGLVGVRISSLARAGAEAVASPETAPSPASPPYPEEPGAGADEERP